MRFRPVLVAAAAAALGCQTPDVENVSGEVRQTRIFRGHYTFGHEVRSFRECGSQDEADDAWVIDETGGKLAEAAGELTSEPYQPIYVEVAGTGGEAPRDGFGAEYARSLRVTEFRRAALEGRGCAEELSGFLFKARGNEPFWNVTIAESGITLGLMDGPPRLEFPFNAPKKGVYSTKLVTTAHELEVRIEKADCADSMSGERFSYRASAVYNGRRLEGCAYEGIPGSAAAVYQIQTIERILPGCGADGGCSWYRFDYPEFGSEALNAVVAKWMRRPPDDNGNLPELEALAERWEQDYLEFKREFPDSAQQWSLRRSVAVLYSAEDSIALEMEEYSDLGGAHPNYSRQLVNLDPATGRRLAVSDALDAASLERLGRTAERIFRAKRGIPDGGSFEEAGFQFPGGKFALNDNFAILAGGLLYYFNDYEIAPHAAGPTEIYIRFADLDG